MNCTLTLDVRSSAKKFIALSSPKHSQTMRSSFFYILASWSAQLHLTIDLFPSMLKSWRCSKSLVTIVLPSKAWKAGWVLGGSRFPRLFCQNSLDSTPPHWITHHPNPSPPCGTSFGGSMGGSACNRFHFGLMKLILLSNCLKNQQITLRIKGKRKC